LYASTALFYKINHVFAKKYIYETALLHLSETVFRRLVLPSSGASSYYIITLPPSGNNICVKYKC